MLILVEVIALCRQARSHWLGQCWLISMRPYCVTRPQWISSQDSVLYLSTYCMSISASNPWNHERNDTHILKQRRAWVQCQLDNDLTLLRRIDVKSNSLWWFMISGYAYVFACKGLDILIDLLFLWIEEEWFRHLRQREADRYPLDPLERNGVE